MRLAAARGRDLGLHRGELRVEARLLLAEVVSTERRRRHEGEAEDEEDHAASGHRRNLVRRDAGRPCPRYGLYAAGRRESSSGGG